VSEDDATSSENSSFQPSRIKKNKRQHPSSQSKRRNRRSQNRNRITKITAHSNNCTSPPPWLSFEQNGPTKQKAGNEMKNRPSACGRAWVTDPCMAILNGGERVGVDADVDVEDSRKVGREFPAYNPGRGRLGRLINERIFVHRGERERPCIRKNQPKVENIIPLTNIGSSSTHPLLFLHLFHPDIL
jgi:hypothetical protein